MPKKLNPMAVRKVLTYEADELARALKVSIATIHNMVRRGMPVMSSQKPYLFSGEEVQDFIKAERASNKTPMAEDELYCPSCRKGQKPAGMLVEYFELSTTSINLKGKCCVCGCGANRFSSKERLPNLVAFFKISKGAESGA